MFEVISMCSQCKLGKSASLQRLVQWSHPQALKFLVMRLFPWIQGHLCDLGWVKWSFSWNPEVSPIAINMLAKMGKPDFPLLGKSLLQEERMNQHRTRTEKWGEQDRSLCNFRFSQVLRLSCRAGDSSHHACILRVEVELGGASLGARVGASRTASGSGPLLLRNSPWGITGHLHRCWASGTGNGRASAGCLFLGSEKWVFRPLPLNPSSAPHSYQSSWSTFDPRQISLVSAESVVQWI